MEHILGVDVGGSKIEAAVMAILPAADADSLNGNRFQIKGRKYGLQSLSRKRIKTERQNGYQSVLERVAELCRNVMQEASLSWSQLNGLGIGMPGSVDPLTDRMANGNSAIFIDKDFKQDLAQLLDLKVSIKIDNDAGCFVLAEALLGVGQQVSLQVNKRSDALVGLGIILGTGVGGGIFSHGQLISGSRGAAAEWGHIPLQANGLTCYCGSSGCVETVLSGPSLEAYYRTRSYSQIPVAASSEEIFNMACEHEPHAMAVVHYYLQNLGRFLATLVQIFDPDYIVLGGGLSKQKLIYENIDALIKPHLFVKRRPPAIVQHTLGDSAGVIGAGLLNVI